MIRSLEIGVYIIYNKVAGKFYVGSSETLTKRLYGHKVALQRNYHPIKQLQRSFNKRGEEAFIFKVIKTCTVEQMLDYEQYYINALQPEYNTRKIAESNKGMKMSYETKIKMSKAKTGRKLSDKTKQILSVINKGKILSEDHRQKLSLAKSNPIVQIDLTTKISIKKFSSILTASKELHISRRNITKVLRGDLASAGGYFWEYLENSYLSRRNKVKLNLHIEKETN